MLRSTVTGVISILLFFLFLHPVNSGDFFHHINTGRDIVTTMRLPYTDTWTFTASGKPWIAHSWGSGVLYYLIYQLSGYEGISIFTALIGVATVFFLALTLRRITDNPWMMLGVSVLTAALMSLRWPTRPEVMAPLFVSVLLYLLPLLKDQKKSYILPFVILLWSIMYGSSVFMGVGLIAAYLLINRYIAKHTLWILLLSGVAALSNGYGWRSFFYIFLIPKIASGVGEWLPFIAAVNPARPPGVVLFYQYPLLLYGLYVLGFVGILTWYLVAKRRMLRDNLWPLLLSTAILAPFVSVRFMNLSPVFAAPLLTILLTFLPRLPQRIGYALVVMLALGAASVRFYTYPLGVGLEQQPFGTTAISYLVDRHVAANIYASQELGAYVKWRLPESRIFFDTRDDLYLGTDVSRDLEKYQNGHIDIITLLNVYRADIVVGDIANATYTPLFYLKTWKLVHMSESMFVAVRTSVAEPMGLPTFEALDPTRVPPVKPGKLTEALREIDRVLASDDSLENHVRKAEILLALGNEEAALTIIDTAAAPGFYGTARPTVYLGLWELKAKFYLAADRCDDAKNAIKKAEFYSQHPFIFFPRHNLLSGANYYWGHYYISCERNIPLAREYLIKYAVQTPNSRERRDIEELLDTLVQ